MNLAGKTVFLALGLITLPAMVSANDFSTETRVKYVMDCMQAHSKLNVYESAHKCSCVIDKIAESFSQAEFYDISAGYRYKNLPADRGAEFRDDKDLQKGIKSFKQTQADAYEFCRLR